MSKDRRYDEEEVRAIISRALEARSGSGLSHADLVDIGEGVGLSRAAVDGAADAVISSRLERAASARVNSRRRRLLVKHALVYVVVNAVLFLINYLSTPGEWWVLFSVFAWGFVLLLHAALNFWLPISAHGLEREKQRLLSSAGKRLYA